jgi:hypothetical protein
MSQGPYIGQDIEYCAVQSILNALPPVVHQDHTYYPPIQYKYIFLAIQRFLIKRELIILCYGCSTIA